MDAYAGRLLQQYGMDYSKFVFLSPLQAGALDVTRLAAALNFSKAAVSKRVPVLEQEGWIHTTEDLSAGRRVLISLSGSGRDKIMGAAGDLNDRFAAMLAETGIDVDGFAAQVNAIRTAVVQLAEGELW